MALACCDDAAGPSGDDGAFSGILETDPSCNVIGGDTTDFLPRPTTDPPNTCLKYACPNPTEGELTSLYFQIAQDDSVWILVYDRPKSPPVDTLYAQQSRSGAYGIAWRNCGCSGIYRVVMHTASGFTSYGDVEFKRLSVMWPLQVRVLDGMINADLMPVIPPDPILCHLCVELRNMSDGCGIKGLMITSAGVLLSKNDAVLGTIHFNPIPPIDLAPLEADTIVVDKIAEYARIFEPPCGENVYLKIKLRDGNGRSFIHKSQAFLFGCSY